MADVILGADVHQKGKEMHLKRNPRTGSWPGGSAGGGGFANHLEPITTWSCNPLGGQLYFRPSCSLLAFLFLQCLGGRKRRVLSTLLCRLLMQLQVLKGFCEPFELLGTLVQHFLVQVLELMLLMALATLIRRPVRFLSVRVREIIFPAGRRMDRLGGWQGSRLNSTPHASTPAMSRPCL